MAEEAANTGAVDESTADSTAEAPAMEADPPGAEALGDPGKKALDAMKVRVKEAEAKARAADEARAALEAKMAGREAEHAAAAEAQRVRDEAIAAANQRILKAEVRAAAAGKLADPQDALRFIDLSTLEVGADGEVDGESVAAAIDDLIKNKPYLAAQGKRFEGGADGGARKESAPDIDAQIAEAMKAGNFALSIALKRQKAQANST